MDEVVIVLTTEEADELEQLLLDILYGSSDLYSPSLFDILTKVENAR
jgi:hypothetical protein